MCNMCSRRGSLTNSQYMGKKRIWYNSIIATNNCYWLISIYKDGVSASPLGARGSAR